MICFDTNIVIYFGNQTLNEDIIDNEPIYYASVSHIEAFGYPDILAAEEQRIEELLGVMIEVPLSAPIIQAAVRLRQFKKMSLGDAIIAATALQNNCVLWTTNVENFEHIDGLRLHNPLKA